MSTNAQVQVRARKVEFFAIDRCLGVGGGAVLCGVLEKLNYGEFPPEICARLAWEPVPDRQRTFRRKIGAHVAVLELWGHVPRLTVDGMQTAREVEPAVLKAAHTAVNEVLALAVGQRVVDKLREYANQRISAHVGERCSQTVGLKAFELERSRLAIRASCGIRVQV